MYKRVKTLDFKGLSLFIIRLSGSGAVKFHKAKISKTLILAHMFA